MKISDCRDVFALLSRYLDRELPDDVCHGIDSHMAECPSCVDFVSSLKKSIELCRSCREMDKPAPLPEGERRQLWEAYQRALAKRKRGEA